MTIKEKNLKLIMELIFIFILPLAVIGLNCKLENEYVYDNNGNFETSQKVLSYDGIDFVSTVYNSEVVPIYIVINDPIVVGSTLIYTDFIEFNSLNRALYYTGEYSLSLLYYDSDLNLINSGALNSTNTITNTAYKYFRIGRGVNAGILDPDLLRNKIYYNSSDNFIVNSPFVNFKYMVAGAFNVDKTDVSFNIIFDYTCLWFLQFVIWHLLYGLFDFLMHLLSLKKKE